MKNQSDPLDKFNFFLGTWKMDYNIPKSQFSPEDNGEAEGEFKRILNNRYVSFDYHGKFSSGEGGAHALFVWDEKSKIYRYWWFEDSGAFMTATCDFIDENTLCLNWHNSLLVQTFRKMDDGKIILQMKHPSTDEEYKSVLDVVFTKI